MKIKDFLQMASYTRWYKRTNSRFKNFEDKDSYRKSHKKQADCETVFDGDHYFSDEAAFERKSRSING